MVNTTLYTADEVKTGALAYDHYAEFNRNPTLAVDIPDGGFTITVKTSEGKRMTFAFQPYNNGGPPQCVDVCYHDSGKTREFNGETLPIFDTILFGQTGTPAVPIQHDTRKADFKPGIVCVLMDNKPNEEPAK